jgi:hypothetical protein
MAYESDAARQLRILPVCRPKHSIAFVPLYSTLSKGDVLQETIHRADGVLRGATSIATPPSENCSVSTNAHKVFPEWCHWKATGKLLKDDLSLKWRNMAEYPVVGTKLCVHSRRQVWAREQPGGSRNGTNV